MSSLSALSCAHLFELNLYSKRMHIGKAQVASKRLVLIIFTYERPSIPLQKVTVLLWGLRPSLFHPEQHIYDNSLGYRFVLCF